MSVHFLCVSTSASAPVECECLQNNCLHNHRLARILSNENFERDSFVQKSENNLQLPQGRLRRRQRKKFRKKILPIEIAVSFSFSEYKNTHLGRAAVVAQLVERSLPTLEICSSNTVSDKVYLLSNEKTKVRKNRGREWPNLPTIHA